MQNMLTKNIYHSICINEKILFIGVVWGLTSIGRDGGREEVQEIVLSAVFDIV